MKDFLAKLSNLVVLLGIYLYFTAWVYVHSFYGHFGISPSALNIDYSTYLVFSFNVFMSTPFLIALGVFAVLGLLWMILAGGKWAAGGATPGGSVLDGSTPGGDIPRGRALLSWLARFRLVWLLVFMAALFPWIFYVAQAAAWKDYTNERSSGGSSLRSIQFVFRKDSDILTPAQVLDTTGRAGRVLQQDLRLLKNDSTRVLKLLGESDASYIVLCQSPFDTVLNALPDGYVYFVDKKDVLLAKITLSSL